MDTEKCRVPLNVLETGSLSAAAVRLGYTPSGVSRMMAALEEEPFIEIYPGQETDNSLFLAQSGIRANKKYSTSDVCAARPAELKNLPIFYIEPLEILHRFVIVKTYCIMGVFLPTGGKTRGTGI